MSVIEKISISSNQLTINYKGGVMPKDKMYMCKDGRCYQDPNGKMTFEECNKKGSGCGGGYRSCSIRNNTSTKISDIDVTWYGSRDNCPPSRTITPLIKGGVAEAGGIGTWDNPITLAASNKKSHNLSPGDCIYIKWLKKYFIWEDNCQECSEDGHFDLWLGTSEDNKGMNGQHLIDCEFALGVAKEAGEPQVILNPPNNLDVTTRLLYDSTNSENNGCIIPYPKTSCSKESDGKYQCSSSDKKYPPDIDKYKLLCGNTCQISDDNDCIWRSSWNNTKGGIDACNAAKARGDQKWRCEDIASWINMSYDDFVYLNNNEKPVDGEKPLLCPKIPCGDNCNEDELFSINTTFCMGDCCGHITNF
tara:strand:- start:320 stop:1405 length:1086 start_codon:yes stop_codon:yes gene_type:complete